MNRNMKKSIMLLSSLVALLTLSGCFGAKSSSMAGRGGEVVGVGGRSFAEPAPYGMVKVNPGFFVGTENASQGCFRGWLLDG